MSQRNGVDAVVVQADATSIIAQWQITTLAIKHRLLAIYQVREFVQDGGLISYGPSITEMTRRSAMFVDEILKGIKPTDLPIEQPTKFELAINLTTAKAVGLIVLPSLPARADVTRSVGAMMDHPRRMKDTMADAYVAGAETIGASLSHNVSGK